jgi:UDP-N-acetyl-D-galactosamine dehydrogenase
MQNFSKKIIAVIGLGYVGLPLAIEFGKNRPVIGFDINKKRINDLKSHQDFTLEVSSADLKKANYLTYSFNFQDLHDAEIFIVTVPTPIDKVNRPDLNPLINASEIVGKALKKGSIVIYESTVYPGCTEEVCVPILEMFSGLKFNEDFYCGYSPERINPGDKINTLTKIKKITSGSTPEIADLVDHLYASIISAGTYKASSMKVAEAAKVIENTQRDLNIALVNELSVLFNRLDIDTTEVLQAAETKWNFLPFRPGMVGGHCIGVDPYYLTYKAEELGYHSQIIASGRRMNDNMARYAARNVIKLMLRNDIDVSKSRVGVMGVTFKENCPDIRNSKVIDLIRELEAWGVEVVVTDPLANANELMHEHGIKLNTIADLSLVDALVVAVAHNDYREMELLTLKKILKPDKPVLADLKAIYDKNEAVKLGLTVFRL